MLNRIEWSALFPSALPRICRQSGWAVAVPVMLGPLLVVVLAIPARGQVEILTPTAQPAAKQEEKKPAKPEAKAAEKPAAQQAQPEAQPEEDTDVG